MKTSINSVSYDYWERIFSINSWGVYPSEDLVRFISRKFSSIPNKSDAHVLEIGCGPGPNIWYLVREGFSVAGIDGSPTAIRQSVERLMTEGLPHQQPYVDLRIGDFSCLPWADESFDVVVDVEALYANSISNIRASILEVKRTLKLGGWFFGKMFGNLTTGSDSGDKIELGTYITPKIGPCAGNAIAHYFTREELSDLFCEFHDLCIDHTIRTEYNEKIQIFEWIVTAHK